MGNPRQVVTGFSAGELSPKLWAHTDLKIYAQGAREILNGVVQAGGEIDRRAGSKYIASTKDNGLSKLIPFQVSESVQYMLEFGSEYIRIYRDQAQLEASSGVPTEIVAGSGHTGGENPPWKTGELDDIRYAQSHDKLFIGHPDYKPLVLSRTSTDDHLPASWDLSEYVYLDGPYEKINIDQLYLRITAAAGVAVSGDQAIDKDVEYTFELHSSSTGTDIQTHGLAASDIGRHLRWLPVEGDARSGSVGGDGSLEWCWFKISEITSTTVFKATAQIDSIDLANTTGSNAFTDGVTEWRLGSWYGNATTYNWPVVPQLHSSRMYWGGETLNLQTISASEVGDFYTLAPSSLDGSVLDTSGFRREIDDDRLNKIEWMESDDRGILVFTTGGPFLLHGGQDIATITPSNVGIKRQNALPCSSTAPPQKVGSGVVFVAASGHKLRAAQYAFDQDRFKTPDLTLRFQYPAKDSSFITDTAFEADPQETLWCVLSNGELASMAYIPDENVIAWCRHDMSGSFKGSNWPVAESVSVIRDDGEDEDLVWVIVKRTINGATKRYVEILQPSHDQSDDCCLAWFSDSGLSTDNRLNITSVIDNTGTVDIEVSTAHGLADGETIRIRTESAKEIEDYGVVTGLGEIHWKTYTVTTLTTTSIRITADLSDVTAWVSGGTIAKMVSSVSGLDHLEGQEVAVYADRAEQKRQTVSSGSITLASPASVIIVGLPQTHRVKSLPPVGPDGEKDPRGIMQSVKDVYLYVFHTLGGKVGPVGGDLYDIEYREGDSPMDLPIDLQTDLIEVGVAGPFDRFGGWVYENTSPMPSTLLGAVVNLDTGNL